MFCCKEFSPGVSQQAITSTFIKTSRPGLEDPHLGEDHLNHVQCDSEEGPCLVHLLEELQFPVINQGLQKVAGQAIHPPACPAYPS